MRYWRGPLAALASGADATLLGRPVLHAPAADQEHGVARTFGILAEQLADAMALSGASSVRDIGPDLVPPWNRARQEEVTHLGPRGRAH